MVSTRNTCIDKYSTIGSSFLHCSEQVIKSLAAMGFPHFVCSPQTKIIVWSTTLSYPPLSTGCTIVIRKYMSFTLLKKLCCQQKASMHKHFMIFVQIAYWKRNNFWWILEKALWFLYKLCNGARQIPYWIIKMLSCFSTI